MLQPLPLLLHACTRIPAAVSECPAWMPYAWLQSITFTPVPSPKEANAAGGPAAAPDARPYSGVSTQQAHSTLPHACRPHTCAFANLLMLFCVGLTYAFACLIALQLGGVATAKDPPYLHWNFRVCGSPVLEFGCIPQQLQVGATQGPSVRAARIPTSSAVCAGQPE